MSRGILAPLQTLSGFYKGHSIPVNDKISEMFLQLHISEKTGRGIPKIVSVYGKNSIAIEENTITITIPFTRLNNVGNKVGNKNLNSTQVKILAEIRNNPNITKNQLIINVGVSKTAIDRALVKLKELKYIERIGSKKTGYWNVKIN